MPLTDTAIRNAKPRAKPYKMMDAKGLFLFVHPNGGRYWRLRYLFGGKDKTLALGTYPVVTLAEARDLQITAKKLLQAGVDPGEQKKSDRREAKLNAENTFKAVAEEWRYANGAKWTPDHAANTWRRLEVHAFPDLGNRPIKSIKPADLLAVVRKIEARGTTEMSHRVLQICGAVFRYAFASGRVEYDPTPSLRGALSSHKVKHYPTLSAKELPDFLKNIAKVDTTPLNKLAVRLLLLTFVRQGELRQARWDDVNFETKEWVLPAHTTKMREEHVVPLSSQTLDLLKELKQVAGNNPHNLLFPSQNRQKKPMMCENTVNNVLRKMGYQGKMVGHGFRALASTILNEQGFRADVIERQLAHKERNKVRAAYNRAEYLEERTAMMQHWADFVDAQATGDGRVIVGRFGKAAERVA